jgi:hypothetical protein
MHRYQLFLNYLITLTPEDILAFGKWYKVIGLLVLQGIILGYFWERVPVKIIMKIRSFPEPN